jgi:hypothetical protein
MTFSRFFLLLWLVVSLAWIGFIVGARFRIGDAYATGFSFTDLEVVAGPPIALLLVGSAVVLALRAVMR